MPREFRVISQVALARIYAFWLRHQRGKPLDSIAFSIVSREFVRKPGARRIARE